MPNQPTPPVVNKLLIRPYFRWGDTLGGGWLTSHHCSEKDGFLHFQGTDNQGVLGGEYSNEKNAPWLFRLYVYI